MKVVIDTNVLVSSFFGGKPRQIMDHWKAGRFTLCLSEALLEEYLRVLGRMGLTDEPEIKELLGLLSQSPQVLYKRHVRLARYVPEDPDDDKVVACALALGATRVVTGDKALLNLRHVQDAAFVTPAQFLVSLQKTL